MEPVKNGLHSFCAYSGLLCFTSIVPASRDTCAVVFPHNAKQFLLLLICGFRLQRPWGRRLVHLGRTGQSSPCGREKINKESEKLYFQLTL